MIAERKLPPLKIHGYTYISLSESGFYYLNTRYYDPDTCRFISPDTTDVLTATPNALTDKNLYVYCDNNPVVRRDSSGYIWKTILDVAGIAWSVVDLVTNPSWANAGYLAWDIGATLLPFIPSSYTAKAVKITAKVASKSDDVIKVAKTTYKVADKASDIKKMTGSYEILYEGGKNYVGKGGYKRMINSAGRYNDEILSMTWKPAKNSRVAFINEYFAMSRMGVNNVNTYNKIWSPGRNYYFNDLQRLFK